MREANFTLGTGVILVFLSLMFLAGGVGCGPTTINSIRLYDQLTHQSDVTLFAIGIVETTYIFLYGSAVATLIFVIFGGFRLVSSWSKFIYAYWWVMMVYGLLFLVAAAYMIYVTSSSNEYVVSHVVGYRPEEVQLRNLINKLFSITQTGLRLWVLTAALFLFLPPIRRGLGR